MQLLEISIKKLTNENELLEWALKDVILKYNEEILSKEIIIKK